MIWRFIKLLCYLQSSHTYRHLNSFSSYFLMNSCHRYSTEGIVSITVIQQLATIRDMNRPKSWTAGIWKWLPVCHRTYLQLLHIDCLNSSIGTASDLQTDSCKFKPHCGKKKFWTLWYWDQNRVVNPTTKGIINWQFKSKL